MKIILIRETPLDSWKRDGGTVVACMALVLPGWWVGSDALQWIGAIMFALFFLTRVFGTSAKHTYSIEEARAALEKMDGNK